METIQFGIYQSFSRYGFHKGWINTKLNTIYDGYP